MRMGMAMGRSYRLSGLRAGGERRLYAVRTLTKAGVRGDGLYTRQWTREDERREGTTARSRVHIRYRVDYRF